MDDLIFATNGSFGWTLQKLNNERECTVIAEEKLNPKDMHCRCLTFSNNGQYFAYCNSLRTIVFNIQTEKEVLNLDLAKTQALIFSPKDRFLVTYEPYVIYGTRTNPDGSQKKPGPNLKFYSIPDGKLLAETSTEKQVNWRPHFNEDDSLALRINGSEIHFYMDGNFERFDRKEVIQNVAQISMSPGATTFIACFIPSKNQPASIQIRSLDEGLPIVSSKTTFNCDKCSFIWNSKGTACLTIASVEVDKTNKSYYGVSTLFCLSTNVRNDSFSVTLDKNGPVHATEWLPSGNVFAVCYGFMPSKIKLFNLKSDTIWDLGEGHRNEIHINPQSTIMATCAFGNLASGKIQLWNIGTKEEITTVEVPHTTHFEWAGDGQHFSTSTTAPRLRTDNSYRVWNYKGQLLHEVRFVKDELWHVKWRHNPSPPKFSIESGKDAKVSKENIKHPAESPVDKLPQGAITSTGKYIPPHLRKDNQIKIQGSRSPKPPSNKSASTSRARNDEDNAAKKKKVLQKKIEDIEKLKEKQKSGIVLEKNQLEKIQSEPKLLKELEHLHF